MPKLKPEIIALSPAFSLASVAVNKLYEYGLDDYDVPLDQDEVIQSLIKPSKITVLHHYLDNFSDIMEDIDNMVKNIDDICEVFYYIKRLLKEVDIPCNLDEPVFDSCSESWHYECRCKEMLDEWIEFVGENSKKINELLVHSAFQLVFLDRNFLHDFHLELAEKIKLNYSELKEEYGDHFTINAGMKRKQFPVWLKDAIFHRDKGHCVICRKDLLGIVNISTKHIDHIIPLKLFGTNDATNLQLLCETCNTTKGARATTTSSLNVPFWNLDE